MTAPSIIPLIPDLALILTAAGVVSFLFHKLKQSAVLGYIASGMMIAPWVHSKTQINHWADLGVLFLMFSIGLEFSFKKLAKIGIPALFIAISEVFGTALIATLVSIHVFHLPYKIAILCGALFSISSTTIVVKTFEELQLKSRRFAELTLAILIAEDLLAILFLAALSSLDTSGHLSKNWQIPLAAFKLIGIVGGWFLMGYFILPRFFKWVGKHANEEMLTLLSLAACLSLATAAAHEGYSIALGAFVMGSILAESTESFRIEQSMLPIRNLFAAIFFVSIGMLIDFQLVYQNLGKIFLFSAVIISSKMIFSTIASLLSGNTFRTSLQIGMALAQVGEFSFIMATAAIPLAAKIGIDAHWLLPVAVSCSLLTSILTPSLNRYSHKTATTLEAIMPVKVKDFLSRYAAGIRTLAATPSNGNNNLKKRLSFFFIAIFLPIFWINLASLSLFKAKDFSIIAAVSIVLVLSLVLFRYKKTIKWMEEQLLAPFHSTEKTKIKKDFMSSLAPWDAHLIRLKLHPNSEFIGITLGSSTLRTHFGLNIIAIQRGLKTIVAPNPEEPLFPKDELLVLGTDEQIEKVRNKIEHPVGIENRFRDLSEYELRTWILPETSTYVGRPLKDCAIREQFQAIVVGVERNGLRTLNPPSTFTFKANDTLWIVGQLGNIDKISNPENQAL